MEMPLNTTQKSTTAGNIAFLLLSFPFGLLYFLVTVIGFTLGLSTLVIWIGIPILFATVAMIRGMAAVERGIVASLLRVPLPRQPHMQGQPRQTFTRRFGNSLRDPLTWTGTIYMILKLPLGIFSFTLALVLPILAVATTLMPLAYLINLLVNVILLRNGIQSSSYIIPYFIEDNMSNQDPSFADPERPGPEQQAYTPREFNADPREQPQWQAAPPPQQGGYVGQGYYGPGPQQMGPGQYGQPWQPYPQKRRQRGPLFWVASCLVVFLIILVLLGGIFALIGLAIGKYGSYSKTQAPRNFVVGAHPTLVVNDDVGTIHINAGGNSVTVQATEHNNGFWGNPNDAQVNYSQNGDTVTVNASVKANLGFFSTDSVDLNITVPSTADLQIKTNTGLIDVSGVNGQMSLSTDTGAIDATNDRLTSSSNLTSNTGEVSFNGSIDTNGGTYLFQADTGEVNVTLPAASSFHLIASTDTGSINSDFPVNIQHPNVTGASVNSDVGSSPKATVTLKANTGAINLHRG